MKVRKSILLWTFVLVLLTSLSIVVKTYGLYPTAVSLAEQSNRSGVSGTVVTVDDWLADYNYYMGLNYTENNNGVLPIGESRNLYSDSNLVKATVTYSGVDMYDNSLVGYVSGSERQDTFIYYKYYPKNNGYIDIELIDTPFTDRPLDMGFNGWLTDYEGVTISFDKNYYKRYAHVPVSGNTLNITFHAHWVKGHYAVITTSNNNAWGNAFNSLGEGMEPMRRETRVYEDITQYYTYGGRLSNNGTYPNDSYNYRGQSVGGTRCSTSWFSSYCYYYFKVTENNYDPNGDEVYYEPSNSGWASQMNEHTVSYTSSYVSVFNNGDKVGGFYTARNFSWNQAVSDYYDDSGNYIENGSCDTYGGCTYYKLVQYYDSNGNISVSDGNTIYYRLITRDMNIIGLGVNLSYTWSSSYDKPFTFTSIYKYTNSSGNVVNGNNLNTYYWNVNGLNVHCYNDTRIENMMIYANISTQVPTYTSGRYTYEGIGTATNSSRFIYGDYHNLKIGRGIIKRNDSQNFSVIIGGNNSANGLGSSSNVTKYHLNIESGFYNAITLTNGALGTTDSKYIEALATYGNDYDRVKKDNSKLDVYWDVVGSFGGNYAASNTTTAVTMDTVVKSGRFGSQEGDDHTAGMYVGGRGGGVHSAVRRVKVEGGWIYNLIGGPLTANNRGNINDIYIYMTGGAVDVIIGGAGTSATYGNRILGITGGQVNYSVFGGSNGYDGDDGDGTLNGSSFVYVGGNAKIGNETIMNSNNRTKWGAESGSVFGIGNGKEGTSEIGSNDNSNVMIDNMATILGNVYGGGNYGATGVSSNSNTNTTHIYVKGGTVNGSIYGGGNNNGAGSTSKTATVTIEMTEGIVNGSIYGGSRTQGTIYGDTNVNVIGGKVKTSVYGGGEGGYSDSNNPGTFVTGNVDVVIGTHGGSDESLSIDGSVYGGSAFGTVNGGVNNRNSTVTNKNTHVTVESGKIGNVFGGGQGSNEEDFIPYVCGNVLVDINGGNITNVFGGNDLKGTPNGSVTVNINNGTVTNAYAGGNQTVVDEPYINIHGGITTNAFGGGNSAKVTTSHVLVDGGTTTDVFGGSNASGDVTTSNVVINAGTVTNAFGGNNVGGTTGTTNVLVNGGTVGTVYGGGEKTDVTTRANVTINSAVSNVFGGSDSDGTVKETNVKMEIGSSATNVYGGNNLGGTTTTSHVDINGGVIENTYGGGLKATTGETHVNLNYGMSDNIYGGGNQAGATKTNVNLGKGYATNVFGGSNNSGNIPNSYIKNISSNIQNANITATVEKSVSTINQTNNQDKVSSESLSVSITNNTGVQLITWDAYLFVSDSVFDSNWSGTNVSVDGNVIHADEVNQWYGTNPLNNGSAHTFNFNVHSSVEYDDYKVYGYIVVGYDSNGNEYKAVHFDDDVYGEKVFGGNNQGGVTTNSHVDLTNGSYGSIYGGGEKATTTAPDVKLDGVTVYDVVYGGGDQAPITTNTNVEIKNSCNILGDVFGGGNAGKVNGNTVVSIDDSSVSHNVYGGGNKADVSGVTSVTISNQSTISENVFGGGNEGKALSTTEVIVDASTVTKSVYGGGNKADVTGATSVTIKEQSTVSENVFGGGNEGKALDDTNVTVNHSNVTKTVYGGGNKADVSGKTNVDILNNSVISENVFGGGNEGKVLDNTDVDIKNSTVNADVFGGGNKASVTGNGKVVMDTVTVRNVYGGGNEASVEGNTSLELKNVTASASVFGGGNNGMVYGNTDTYLHNSTVGGSAYAGGNGATATVYGNNVIDVDGTTSITDHLFGGGNAAKTGCEENVVVAGSTICQANHSYSKVNVAGATIGGNVYGGANTSVVYGETFVNIGRDMVSNSLTKGNIHIGGTVFGGGEANASGSEDYDFNFISVTRGININIDANGHDTFLIDGSIFGSGNASSSGGYSYVTIHNYGTTNTPKENISIQRADIVTLDNSSIALQGAQDRTNKYKSELFTLSRIGHLKLKNGSSIYLERGANLLEEFSSLVDVNGEEVKEVVTINEGSQSVTKNVDNRVYMIEGRNLNISDDESLATYGNVNGMAFYGMFKRDRNGNVATGRYSDQYDYGSSISGSEQYYFNSGSYVVGKHKSAHDYYKDGFYSHYPSEDGSKIVVDYIEPSPSDATYYRWTIGESVEVLEVSLTASKYSTLGTFELQLMDYYHPNTEISVLGVNFDNLSNTINLLDDDDIPRVADSEVDANHNFGLAMKSGNVGWITRGSTDFLTTGQDMSGTTLYRAENTNDIPSFVFYLYHSKNITESKSMGSVVISLMVATPTSDLSNKMQRINIEVSLNTALYEGDNYEGSIAPGYQYKLFANTNVNITSKSAFSTYFSLFSTTENLYKPGSYRSLVSSYALPVNTKITMIDFAAGEHPMYYYYIVDEAKYQASVLSLQNDGEVSYRLSDFIKMGSSSPNNTYNDSSASNSYYHSDNHTSEEEFIFIVDLKDTNLNSDVMHKSMLLELRESNDNPVVPVLDISQQKMFYNLYSNKEAVIDANASLSNRSLYVGQNVDLTVVTNFTQQKIDNTTVIDTNYYDKRLGIKLSLYDSNDELVNGASMLGTAFVYQGVRYYPRQDGTVRFNIAESVANVSSKITIDATTSSLATGDYKLVIDTFGSSDGIYYGLVSSKSIEKDIRIINDLFGLKVNLDNNDVLIDKDTGMGVDENDYLDFQIQYSSGLTSPNIRVSMYRRTYTDVYLYDYELVDFQDYVKSELVTTSQPKMYMVNEAPLARFQYIVSLKEHLKTGTYQIRFNLFDGDNFVGYVSKYIIIE